MGRSPNYQDLSPPSATLFLGQELSDKPFSLLSALRAARPASGGPKGKPAGDERHRRK